MSESPTLEKPETTDPKPAPAAASTAPDETAELLATLKKLGVEKPEQIDGMAEASKHVGKAWNEVGMLRQKVSQLEQALTENSRPRVARSETDYMGGMDSGAQTIDLGQLIDAKLKPLTGFVAQLQQQQQIQEAIGREMQEIQDDPDYALLAPVWEKHIANTNVQQSVAQGRTSLQKEYTKVYRAYTKELLKRAGSVIETKTGQTKPPHMEQGDTRSEVRIPPSDEIKQKAKKINEARSKGAVTSDQALEDLVKTFLPADDPTWRV